MKRGMMAAPSLHLAESNAVGWNLCDRAAHLADPQNTFAWNTIRRCTESDGATDVQVMTIEASLANLMC